MITTIITQVHHTINIPFMTILNTIMPYNNYPINILHDMTIQYPLVSSWRHHPSGHLLWSEFPRTRTRPARLTPWSPPTARDGGCVPSIFVCVCVFISHSIVLDQVAPGVPIPKPDVDGTNSHNSPPPPQTGYGYIPWSFYTWHHQSHQRSSLM